jgi:hypothetical protein
MIIGNDILLSRFSDSEALAIMKYAGKNNEMSDKFNA